MSKNPKKSNRLFRLLAAILLPALALGILLMCIGGFPIFGRAVTSLQASFLVYPLVAIVVAGVIWLTYTVLGAFSGHKDEEEVPVDAS